MVDSGILLTEECTRDAMSIRQKHREGEDLVVSYMLEHFSDIVVRFVEIDGIVRVMVEIGEKTTHQDIRDAIPFMLQCRDRVQDQQSDKIAKKLLRNIRHPHNKEELLELFSYMQEHGISYKKLAERFNNMISNLLDVHLKSDKKIRLSDDDPKEYTSARVYAENFLKAMGMSKTDIDENLNSALEQMENGKTPFEEGYPISRSKMIELLRTWRKGKLHQSVKIALKKAHSRKKDTS